MNLVIFQLSRGIRPVCGSTLFSIPVFHKLKAGGPWQTRAARGFRCGVDRGRRYGRFLRYSATSLSRGDRSQAIGLLARVGRPHCDKRVYGRDFIRGLCGAGVSGC